MPRWIRRTGVPTRIFACLLFCELLRSGYGFVYFPGQAFGLPYSTKSQGPDLFSRSAFEGRQYVFPAVSSIARANKFLAGYGFTCREETSRPFADQPALLFNICRSTEHKPFVWFPAPEWIVFPGPDGTLRLSCNCNWNGP
jgi:hypothetical protein